MLRRSPLLFVCALVVGACSGLTHPQDVPLGEPFWLDIGASAILPASPHTIRFAEVLEDSRCPAGPLIHCVWAGRVRLRITVHPPLAGVESRELRLIEGPTDAAVGGYVVSLLAVEPPAGSEAPPPSAYRAQFMVTAVR